MKRKVEIIADKSEVIQLTKMDLIERLQSDPVGTLSSYDLDDEIIVELIDFIPVDILLACCNLSESLIKRLLEAEYLNNEKLSDLSLTSISKLSQEFLDSKIEYIDFDRLLLNYSVHDDEFFLKNDPNTFIERTNLHGQFFWRILSSNKLPKETILKYQDQLDWVLLTINNNFSDFTEEEFEQIRPYLGKLEEAKNETQSDESVFTTDSNTRQDIDELINKIVQKY